MQGRLCGLLSWSRARTAFGRGLLARQAICPQKSGIVQWLNHQTIPSREKVTQRLRGTKQNLEGAKHQIRAAFKQQGGNSPLHPPPALRGATIPTRKSPKNLHAPLSRMNCQGCQGTTYLPFPRRVVDPGQVRQNRPWGGNDTILRAG